MKSKDPGMFKMYKKEHEDFKLKLSTPGIAENMWQELENLVNRKNLNQEGSNGKRK